MQPEDPFDVPFCDLCNASVPLQDLEQGLAVRHQGKTIGACCLVSLRAAGGPAAVGAALGDTTGGAPASRSPAAAAVRAAAPGAHDSRLLPFAIAMLAAMAAATIFLDYRLGDIESTNLQETTRLENKLVAQAEVLQGVSVDLDSVVRRKDVEDLGVQVRAFDARLAELAEQTRGVGAQVTTAAAELEQQLRDVEARRPDYGPVLTELRQALQKQTVTLAELMARPRAEPRPATLEPEPAPAVPGLPPNLAHEIGRLKDDDPATRFQAVDELLRSKNVLVLEHLLPMLKDDDLFVRRLTVEGLRDFRDPKVVDALLVALSDPEDIVRDTAWRSLQELTGQKLPFDASAAREARARAQQRWQEWWEKNRDSFS